MEEMDNSIGLIMQKLKDLGLDDNTFVFFTSGAPCCLLRLPSTGSHLFHAVCRQWPMAEPSFIGFIVSFAHASLLTYWFCFFKAADGGSAGLFRGGKGSTWEGGMREVSSHQSVLCKAVGLMVVISRPLLAGPVALRPCPCPRKSLRASCHVVVASAITDSSSQASTMDLFVTLAELGGSSSHIKRSSHSFTNRMLP